LCIRLPSDNSPPPLNAKPSCNPAQSLPNGWN
jgi:hypothetical protein